MMRCALSIDRIVSAISGLLAIVWILSVIPLWVKGEPATPAVWIMGLALVTNFARDQLRKAFAK